RLGPAGVQHRLLSGGPPADPPDPPGGGHRRRRVGPATLLARHPAAPFAHHPLSAGDQHHVLPLRNLRRHRRHHPGRARRGDGDPGLQGVQGRLHRPGRGLLGRPIGGPHGAGHHPHRAPVPLRREEGHLLMSVFPRAATRPMIQPRAARARLKQRLGRLAAHLLLLVSIGIIAFPVYSVFVLSTQSMEEAVVRPTILRPSTHLVANYITAWSQAGMGRKLLNSLVVAITVAVGKIVITLLSAFAIVYFRFALRKVVFWLIFITLMLPVEVRIVATYQVVSDLGWLNSYVGLTVPLMASATATFLFRQFLQTVPGELAEAAQLDGAGPMRFLWSILLPLSWTNIAALFVVLFVYGWNQYLWPLMITHTEEMQVAVIGIKQLVNPELPQWNITMAAAMMTLLPPVLVILVMQRWFVKGLIESEK